jgi:hypothetical protein
MRVGAIIIVVAALVFIAGCQRKRPPVAGSWHEARLGYQDSGREAALAMDPPIIQDNPRLMLARDIRERSAFVGFDQGSTTFFWVRMDDRQTEDVRNDRFERRSVTVRVGTSYR